MMNERQIDNVKRLVGALERNKSNELIKLLADKLNYVYTDLERDLNDLIDLVLKAED